MTLLAVLPETPFTTATARDLGLDHHDLSRLVETGELRRVLRGAYQRAACPDTLESRCAAASLVMSRHAVACDRLAAWIWGVDTFSYRETEILPPLECCVLRSRSRVRRPEIRGCVRDLDPSDVVPVNGVLVTTPLRTALDLACRLPRRNALVALDALARLHGLSRTDLERGLVRYVRRRGVIQARALIPLVDPRSESPGESVTRLAVLDEGIPVPELQWWVRERGREVYRLDLAWPRHRVAVEYDGREYHDDEARRRHDQRRRAWLHERGWTVIVVTKDDFTPERLSGWVSQLRCALRLD